MWELTLSSQQAPRITLRSSGSVGSTWLLFYIFVYLFLVVRGIETRALHTLGKHSTMELHSSASYQNFKMHRRKYMPCYRHVKMSRQTLVPCRRLINVAHWED